MGNQLQAERLGVTPKSKELTPEQQKIKEAGSQDRPIGAGKSDSKKLPLSSCRTSSIVRADRSVKSERQWKWSVQPSTWFGLAAMPIAFDAAVLMHSGLHCAAKLTAVALLAAQHSGRPWAR